MKTITRTFAIATLAIALFGTSVILTTAPAEAGPGTKSVSGLDLGSGRIWGW